MDGFEKVRQESLAGIIVGSLLVILATIGAAYKFVQYRNLKKGKK
jgi:hypothetical protein